jgi:hypothetical protein
LPAPDLGGGGGHIGGLEEEEARDRRAMVGSVEGRSSCGGMVAASAGDVVAGDGRRGLAGDGSGGVPGVGCPVPASSASPYCSFEGAGSGWQLGSSVSWPSSGWATVCRRWLAEGWRSSEPTLPGLSSGEVLVSGGLLRGEFGGGLWRTSVSIESALPCEDLSCGLSAAGFSGSVVTMAAAGCVSSFSSQIEDLSLTNQCRSADKRCSVS